MTESGDFNERLATIARDLRNEPDLQHTLQRVVDTAAVNLDRELFASVSLVRERLEVYTPASSDDRALHADQLQYQLHEGPCLDAIWEHETFQIDDMVTEGRYPNWARRVADETGIRSSLSLQLFTNERSLGALNLYSPQVEAFDHAVRWEGLAFAAQAAIAMRSALNEQHLRIAMVGRNLIGQAQGILMERFKLSAVQAFTVLARVSQEHNIKLRDVAQRLIDTGETPGG